MGIPVGPAARGSIGMGTPVAAASTVFAAAALRSTEPAVLSTTAMDSLTGAGVVDLNALAPWVTPVTAPAVTAPIAPAFRESLKLPPAMRDEPAPATKPWVAASKAGAAVATEYPHCRRSGDYEQGRTDNDLTNCRIGKLLNGLTDLLK
jgi:hypothetical protein